MNNEQIETTMPVLINLPVNLLERVTQCIAEKRFESYSDMITDALYKWFDVESLGYVEEDNFSDLEIDNTEKVFAEIIEERLRQNEKWGEQNHSPLEWIAILTEEVGEVAREAHEFHFGVRGTTEMIEDKLRKYRWEMVQVAAVAVQAIECLDRKKGNYRRQFSVSTLDGKNSHPGMEK